MSAYIPSLKQLSAKYKAQLGGIENDVQLLCADNNVRVRETLVGGNWSQEDPIFEQVYKGDLKKVQEYLKQKRRVNIKSNFGLTLFQLAAQGGHLEVVKLLVESQREKLQSYSRMEQSSALMML